MIILCLSQSTRQPMVLHTSLPACHPIDKEVSEWCSRTTNTNDPRIIIQQSSPPPPLLQETGNLPLMDNNNNTPQHLTTKQDVSRLWPPHTFCFFEYWTGDAEKVWFWRMFTNRFPVLSLYLPVYFRGGGVNERINLHMHTHTHTHTTSLSSWNKLHADEILCLIHNKNIVVMCKKNSITVSNIAEDLCWPVQMHDKLEAVYSLATWMQPGYPWDQWRTIGCFPHHAWTGLNEAAGIIYGFGKHAVAVLWWVVGGPPPPADTHLPSFQKPYAWVDAPPPQHHHHF